MTSSQLNLGDPLPPECSVGSEDLFAVRTPAVPGCDTVIAVPRSPSLRENQQRIPDSQADSLRNLLPKSAATEDMTGVKIGHFTIQSRIGIGGMGTVFLAVDDRLRRHIALKILSPSLSAEPASVQRFQNEACAAAKLDHDNIARVFFYGEESGLHYIAYEFVPGSNLREVIQLRGKLDPAEAVNYTIQLAGALSHTSAAGIVHRDIKPSNILITPQRRAKLVDLGLARHESQVNSVELTVAGTTLGTFDYISPEQAKDPRNVDVRSDIYSLGCTLYHMLTGEPPYPEGTVLQKLLDHQGKDAPDPAVKNRLVSPALSAIVRRMMASDPRRRFTDPGELLRALLLVARSLGSGAVPIDGKVWLTATRYQQSRWQRNVGWIGAAGTLLLVVTALQGFPRLRTPFFDSAAAPYSRQSPPNDLEQPQRNRESPQPNTDATGRFDSDAVESKSHTTSPKVAPVPTLKSGSPLAPAVSDIAADSGQVPLEEELFHKPGTLGTALPLTATPLPKNMFGPNGVELLTSSKPLVKDRPSPVNNRSISSVPGDEDSSAPPTRNNASTRVDGSPVVDNGKSPIFAKVVSVLDDKSYSSLEAACAEAKEGSIIELRYDGASSVAERPIRLASKKNIIIRGGIGYRPVITFAPPVTPSEATPSSMITVKGGSLELVNVDLVFSIPNRVTADRWTLFSLERPEKFQLRGVTITVSNSNRQTACVIEQVVGPGQGFNSSGLLKNGMPVESQNISITESLVRGECDLIHLRDSASIRYSAKDTLVALNGVLLRALCETEPSAVETDHVTFELEHTTCFVSNGLIIIEGIDNLTHRTPPIRVVARNNIISTGISHPLVVMSDLGDLMDMEIDRQFAWNGDCNYYDAITVFWRLGGRLLPTLMRQHDFESWRNHWNSGSSRSGSEGVSSTNTAVLWRTNPKGSPWTTMTAHEFELATTSVSNAAVNGASDGTNAGATLKKIPVPPHFSANATKSNPADFQ